MVLGNVTAGDDLLRVEAVYGSQLFDSRAVSTEDDNPIVFVLVDKCLEGCVGLDELLFVKGHGKSETKARGVGQLRESSSVGQKDEGDRIGLKHFKSLLRTIERHFASQEDTVNVEGKREIAGHALQFREDA